MKTTLTLLKNNGDAQTPYRLKVIAFQVDFPTGMGKFRDVTNEVYQNLTTGAIRNTLKGVNVPPVDFNGEWLEVRLTEYSFHTYYRHFLSSCIPIVFSGDVDVYVEPERFEKHTGVSTKIRGDVSNRLGNAWLDYIRKTGDRYTYTSLTERPS